MGVPGLTALLKRYAPTALTRLPTGALQGTRIAIDASCPLNRFVYGNDAPNRHIHGFYFLTRICQHFAIHPLFVFDGTNRLPLKTKWEHQRRKQGRAKISHSLVYEKGRAMRIDNMVHALQTLPMALAPEASLRLLDQLQGIEPSMPPPAPILDDQDIEFARKQQQLEDRLLAITLELRAALDYVCDASKYTRTVRQMSERELSIASDMVQGKLDNVIRDIDRLQKDNQRMLQSLRKRAAAVTPAMREDCIEFLRALGYPCFTCDGHEAEAMCANMVTQGYANATASEDMDTIVFGDAPVLRYFLAKYQTMLRVDPMVARRQMGLSKQQFVDLCILCGTDFGTKIHGIGPVRALKLIKQHGSIEALLPHLDTRKYIPEEGFDFVAVRKIFHTLPPIPSDTRAYDLKDPDTTMVRYLLQKYDVDAQQIDAMVDAYINTPQHQYNSPQHPADFGPDPFT
ncbi:PIN domain-like protein [Gongronella butleri]|nr:PIN domain-like protein [Gongronella butleri]